MIAVAGRAGDPPAPSPALAAVPHRVLHLPMPAMPESSTEIRRLFAHGDAAAKRKAAGMVPAAVARYIARHHPYS